MRDGTTPSTTGLALKAGAGSPTPEGVLAEPTFDHFRLSSSRDGLSERGALLAAELFAAEEVGVEFRSVAAVPRGTDATDTKPLAADRADDRLMSPAASLFASRAALTSLALTTLFC